MADIFISYTRKDVSIVKFLASELNKAGWSVWWDHDIPAGKDYDVVIENALSSAKCVIVLWSSNSINSRNVKDEANVALERSILIPVVIGDVRPPMGFRMIQTVMWQGGSNNKEGLDELLSQVRNLIGGQVSNAEQESQTNTQTTKPEHLQYSHDKKHYQFGINKNYIFFILGAILIAILVLYTFSRRSNSEPVFTGTVLINGKPKQNVIVNILENQLTATTDAFGKLSIPYDSKLKKLTLRFLDSTVSLDTSVSIDNEKLKESITFQLLGKMVDNFGPPELLSPKDRQSFNIFPRATKLVWRPVNAVKSYNVEIQMGNFSNDGDVKWYPLREVIVQDTTFTFDFVGAQPGRWRVFSINNKDEYSSPSQWRWFNYLK